MKIAIVTGASSGMGREFVLQLSQYVSVDEVWVIARRTRALEDLRSQVSVALRPISLDLCADESFAALSDILKEEQPDVKLLVNAAGFGKFGCTGAAIFCSWTACPPSSRCPTSPPTAPPRPSSSATAGP